MDSTIHAGDFTEVKLLEELKHLIEVKAVQGNVDSMEINAILPAKETIEVELIEISHGSGSPWGIEERVRKTLESDSIDVIVYGHSHRS